MAGGRHSRPPMAQRKITVPHQVEHGRYDLGTSGELRGPKGPRRLPPTHGCEYARRLATIHPQGAGQRPASGIGVEGATSHSEEPEKILSPRTQSRKIDSSTPQPFDKSITPSNGQSPQQQRRKFQQAQKDAEPFFKDVKDYVFGRPTTIDNAVSDLASIMT